MRSFEIYYNNPEVSVEEVKDAVKKELEGPERLLGYRAMHKKVRQEYNLHVTRDAVYNVMYDLDPEGLKARGGIGAKKKRKKGNFSSKGPNFVHSLDGHDKMMGTKTAHFHWLFTAALIQQAEKYCGFESGRQIRIQNWLVVGTWNICWSTRIISR